MPDEPFSFRLYRWLLKFYPAGFRENYAEPLERAFRDELNESTGVAALFILWVRLIADVAISVPLQFFHEAAQDARHTFRLWARRPWHTGFAILALAIGIGANTGVFSVVNALAFALLLAVIGIYGIVSYTVARRTHEMGVRMAPGTTPARLRISLLGHGLITIAAGAIPGIAGAVVSGRLLESLVDGAKSVNVTAYAASVLLIALIAAIGIWAATRPIARLDIVEILRTE